MMGTIIEKIKKLLKNNLKVTGIDMKIFVIPTIYPNKNNPNLGIYVHEQCRALQKAGHKIIVLDASGYRLENWFERDIGNMCHHKLDGVEVYSLHYRDLMSTRLPRVSVLRYMRKLRKIFKIAVLEHGNPDLFHAHFTFTSGYCTSILSKENKIPFVITEHNSLFLQPQINTYIQNLVLKATESAHAFICVSMQLSKALKKMGVPSRDLIIIPNMVDERFSYEPMQLSKKFVFFSAGNLVKNKRFDFLIDAFCEAFSIDDEVCLWIAGSGPQELKLKKIIKLYMRKHQIQLLGNLDREIMLKCYKESNCFVLASEYETFGIVYREAMAVGRPVISIENSGIEEGWSENYGKLIKAGEINDLAKGMKDIVHNINEYNFKEISNACLKRYSPDRITDQIIEIYNEVTNHD